ncbi:MAG: ATP-dependent DNA helicase RecQ [Tunicatimonas sp.]|uniref:RecQ family ATP-dependent DNA helicase n=1 Tax=Tunicatimonas sp. TaxID=1940096 RepID=UPI003C733B6B
MSAHAILQQYWGYPAFRPLQEDIIDAVLAGHDTLALLPTGGGKSICFQVPALMREGVCIVISPLIALMKDQVEQLKKRSISAVAIYSGMSAREIDFHLDNCVFGNVKFLYVSPERLRTDLFLARARRMQISLLAVDEAHCVSQWGYDFRPPYLQIADFRAEIPDVNVIALTATATDSVKQDIQDKLQFQNTKVFQKSFARANLSYSSFYEEDKDRRLLKTLTGVPGTAVVYARSRKRTRIIAKKLQGKNISADYYHAGLTAEERADKQDAWIQDRTRVIVATNAFGMGIDKPDVRLVVHLDLPDTLEAYYQEAGRAGRDEKKAYAVVLYDQNDLDNLIKRIETSFPSVDFIRTVYQNIANYLKVAVGSSYLSSYNFDLAHFAETYRLNPIGVFHSIKRLAEEGLLQLNESFFQPSTLHFRVDYQELYKFRIANAALEPTINALLRVYGGELYANYISISESQLAQILQTSVNGVMVKLKNLHEREIINYLPRKDQPQLVFMTPRLDARQLPLSAAKLQKKKTLYADKVNAVTHYVTHPIRCRTQVLLAYFGEKYPIDCGVCDHCLRKKKGKHPEYTRAEQEKIRDNIIQQLTQSSQPPEKLMMALGQIDEAVLARVVKEMLDQGDIFYDGQGCLTVS